MPLKRTPPPSATTVEAGTKCAIIDSQSTSALTSREEECTDDSLRIQHYDSAPDLHSMMENISERKKRKFESSNSDITDVIKQMFTTFTQDQAVRFKQLQKTIDSLKDQNRELKRSVEHMSDQYDEFLNKITKLEAERREDKKMIYHLQEKIEYLERKTKSTMLEIRNIPKISGENKKYLSNLISTIGKTINVEIDQNLIKDIYRGKSKDSSNLIIAEFTTVIVRDNILQNVKKFNKTKIHGDKLNTGHLNLKFPAQPIYISEALTSKTQKLFYQARLTQKQLKYDFCWTSHGVVYLRKHENSPHIKIISETDIENLKKSQ
ncbi:unnamed protein product [Diatraea saccharalis]|uniref:FP protein C-terminal domain-containing protein n=1 Tax=Diatraea saccharalis TaxID=40085 RepID=A0A9N9R689_9NEOP|nr:unnamed protein product [Diatraea saccharalis]